MDRILERLSQLPVIDVHTHFEGLMDTFGYTMPQFLYNCSYTVVYEPWFDPADVALIHGAGDERQQFEALIRMVHGLRHSQTGSLVRRIAEMAGAALEPEAYDALQQWYAQRNEACIRKAMPRIRGMIANSAGHPLYGGLAGLKSFIDGDRVAGPGVYRSAAITDLHSVHDRRDLEAIGCAADMEINTFEDWENACKKLIFALKDIGVVAFKELHLYFRSPRIGLPQWPKAAAEFSRVMKGETASAELQDMMLFRVYEIISQTGLPVQVHTGTTLTTAQTAAYLPDMIALMQAFPTVRFDLLHLNYPLLENYEMVLRSCPNSYGNATWIFTTDPGYTKRYLDFALDAFPLERTCYFGSDRHCAGFPVAAALEQADRLLAAFFAPRIQRGMLSLDDAEQIASVWLMEAPRQLFGIQDPKGNLND